MDRNYKIVGGLVTLLLGLGVVYARQKRNIPTISAKNLDDELNAILRKKAIRITGHKF